MPPLCNGTSRYRTERNIMRKYQQFSEDARELTGSLCGLLALAALGTVIVSAIAMAAVAVASSRAYLGATVRMEIPPDYWSHLYLQRLFESAVLITLVVAGTAIYRTIQLREGGGQLVARLAGGTRVHRDASDLSHRKLLNVVEELAIATGLRAPPVFVLEGEEGINAFAAGYHAQDAVIGVTRGAIDRLTRQQLQGVVAHEYSHIVHGDMRLNIQLIGILTGLQSLTLIAAFLIRLGLPNRTDARPAVGPGKHPLGMVLAFVFGAILWPIGQIGSLFASLVKYAVNRQREYLADASAVQFTRDPDGLREALQVIQDEYGSSRVSGREAQAMSHLFFADIRGGWTQLLDTHPPLAERIRRLETIDMTCPAERSVQTDGMQGTAAHAEQCGCGGLDRRTESQ